jgi:hypothetical protein
MKESGITRKNIIDCIIADFMENHDITKSHANELFNEAIAFNTVTAEIYERMSGMLYNPDERLDWTQEKKQNRGVLSGIKKCNDCEAPAIYALKVSEHEIISVCESCDEDYTICKMCGYAVLSEKSRFFNQEDDCRTCYKCEPHEKEEQEA